MTRARAERPDLARPSRVFVGLTALATAACILAATATAHAAPQITAGATTGLALTDARAENGPRAAYHLGARLDLLFLREAPRDMAIGPYVDVATAAFDTFETGGGIAWLVPTGATAFVFSGGAFGRTSRFGWEPGVAGTIFWGSRSYNFHSAYAIGVGLFAQGRYGLGDGKQADAIVGVQIDLEYLALPFVLAYEAIAH
ncbi:MAG: hypothetical protein JWO86_7649 [Myxococcaceae bacterium]|jgi:hypothetical protein|nr:hypothetical protein [Myxococcaceae bacterium]MEA2750688.1 hypothetical protein [Myxococcales bacterium]